MLLATGTTIVNAQYVANSVLAVGDWWKIGIAEAGVYRLTGSDVSALSGCAIADIAVYGNSGGPLATTNGEPRCDDLVEIPIEVVDRNGNGQFDDDDYIMLYAEGANQWKYSDDFQRIIHINHPYSQYNYIYLTIKSGTHRRITEAPQLSSLGTTVSTCHSVAVHENDVTNTHKSGQIWVGERFYGGNSQ